jgi:endogenous inhibitor of DNA gyrase (YacG/DUF329 family)
MAAEKCPICKAEAVHAYRPFCSERCKLVDLHKWFSEEYTIPIMEDDESDDKEVEKREETH